MPVINPYGWRQFMSQLRARRNVIDHSANNGVRTVGPPTAELNAADIIDYLWGLLHESHNGDVGHGPCDCDDCRAFENKMSHSHAD